MFYLSVFLLSCGFIVFEQWSMFVEENARCDYFINLFKMKQNVSSTDSNRKWKCVETLVRVWWWITDDDSLVTVISISLFFYFPINYCSFLLILFFFSAPIAADVFVALRCVAVSCATTGCMFWISFSRTFAINIFCNCNCISLTLNVTFIHFGLRCMIQPSERRRKKMSEIARFFF